VAAQIAMVDYLVLDDGEPHLVANVCTTCAAEYLDRRNACARCEGRDFRKEQLSSEGVVRTFSIVHRAAKGVPAPYVSAVVDLDGGGRVKSNIVGTEADPEHVKLGMRVRLTTYVTATDDKGTEAVAFGYEPVAG
jgi:uncharacterized protein